MNIRLFVELNTENRRIICHGDWNLPNFTLIRKQLHKIHWPTSGNWVVDGKNITSMDSAGAWLLDRHIKRLNEKGVEIHFENFPDETKKLIEIIEKRIIPPDKIPKKDNPNWLAQVGRQSVREVLDFWDYLGFVGVLSYEFLRGFFQPKHWRFKPLVNVIDTTGYKALPIIGLLSFMIGVVISYQMGNQLRNYGANVFIVNLLGLSILREFGPLITAIMVAGRTGSAFTAELGIMKINQEIDALNTMGVTPAELLLIPRIIGLVLTLPLLTMWADIFGILGGMLMAENMLGISFYDFLHRFQHEIPMRSLLIGLGKAPVFALIIASIGCFQGMQVKSNAESLGRLTTKSVVLAIFFIIVADAIFSVIFSRMNL
jgi:phospholipid/cholesterol/gamma-HCH transport system permease protein